MRAPRPTGASRPSDLGPRVVTMAVAFPALGALLAWAPPAAFALVVALASAAMAAELAALLRRGAAPVERAGAAVASLALVAAVWAGPAALAAPLTPLALLALAWRLAPGAPRPTSPVAALTAALGGALPFAAAVVHRDGGAAWTALLLAATWGGDVAGYVVGRTLGRRRLAPRVSPNKTVAGAIAALTASAAAGAALAGALRLAPVAAAGLGLAAGTVALAGDLGGSLVKRRAGVKDSGALVPGHGGALDVLDGVALAGPFLYAALGLLGR